MTRETLWYLIYPSPRRDTSVETIMAAMANQACMAFDFFFCSSPGILRQPLHLARERETFWYLFRLCTPYGSRVSLTGEEEERKKERKKMTIFDFFQSSFSRLL